MCARGLFSIILFIVLVYSVLLSLWVKLEVTDLEQPFIHVGETAALQDRPRLGSQWVKIDATDLAQPLIHVSCSCQVDQRIAVGVASALREQRVNSPEGTDASKSASADVIAALTAKVHPGDQLCLKGCFAVDSHCSNGHIVIDSHCTISRQHSLWEVRFIQWCTLLLVLTVQCPF